MRVYCRSTVAMKRRVVKHAHIFVRVLDRLPVVFTDNA
jgi:hypothetical protein